MSSGKAWVLVEVPPHRRCALWPRTAGGVAEWRWVGSEVRPLSRAGRRSAGLGGNGRAWPRTHAVGVRACGEWAIWSGMGH